MEKREKYLEKVRGEIFGSVVFFFVERINGR